jgi:hypothetical protein
MLTLRLCQFFTLTSLPNINTYNYSHSGLPHLALLCSNVQHCAILSANPPAFPMLNFMPCPPPPCLSYSILSLRSSDVSVLRVSYSTMPTSSAPKCTKTSINVSSPPTSHITATSPSMCMLMTAKSHILPHSGP